jgi:LuxR family maltose regulon positive regulatory protein
MAQAAASPLIVTQILTPKKRADLLRRPRLVDFIHEHIDRKLTMVSASAGYGKTSLLVDYVHDTDLPVCWLSLVESARDPRVFLDYLIAAINHHFPQFGRNSRGLLYSNESLSDPTLFIGTLVNEIHETIPDYFVVVIDDYHLMDTSRAVNHIMDTLVQHLPENCHFIISSRTIPVLTPRGLALLTARQQVAGLGVNDLRFTAAEIQALLWQNHGQRLPDPAASELAEKSEGWITGILLTTHTMWKGLFEGIIRIQGSDSKVYDYLANEVLSEQPVAVQDFLLSTAILEEMSPVLCDELLGTGTSRETLKLLEDRNLFVSRLERGEERWYRYHNLFREFLLAKLQKERPEQVCPLHLSAAHVLRSNGEVERAIPHYFAAQDYGSATEAILEIANQTYDAGKLEMLAGWIDALSAEIVQARPRLVFLRAKIHSELGQFDQAMTLFDTAYEEFTRSADCLGQAQVLVEKSTALRFRGAFREAIAACQQAIALIQGLERRKEVMQLVASAHRQIGTCQANLGNLAQGEEELRLALNTYEQMGYLTNIAHVHNDLGVILRWLGNHAGSESHFRQALEGWEKIGNVGMAALTINNIAVGHHYRGEYATALELYEDGLNRAKKAGLDRAKAFILAGMGDVHRDQGTYTEALQAYEEGLQAARQSRDASLICYLLDAIGNTHRLLGNSTLASDFIGQAYEDAKARNSTFEVGLYQISLGALSYGQGNVRQAEEYLLKAREVLLRSDAKRELAKASLYLAQTYYVAGRLQEALDSMNTVLGCLLELGYDHFLLPVTRETRSVVEYAVGRGMGGTVIGHLLRKEAVEASVAGAGTAAKKEPPAKPLLRIYALGESRALRGDALITNAEWGMAKSKELLFYLLSHKQRRKEQIGDDLWPELSPAKLRASFHVTLYWVRRALDQRECIKYEGENYFFNRSVHYWFDVEEFEEAIRRAQSVWASDPAKAAKHYQSAVVLYGGDFVQDLSTGLDWCLLKREELLQKYLTALQRLGDYCHSAGSYADAVGFYERILEKDNYQESAYQGIMRCLVLLGERSAALRTYQKLAKLLEEELGATPCPETTTLYEQILKGKINPS